MAQQKRTYPAEFKRRMVELVPSGRSPDELAKEFGPSPNRIRDRCFACEPRGPGIRCRPGCEGARPYPRRSLPRSHRL